MTTALTTVEVRAQILHRWLWANRRVIHSVEDLPAIRGAHGSWNDPTFWAAWDQLVARGHVQESPAGRLLIAAQMDGHGC